MISKEAIKKTGYCSWSFEDDCFIAKSSLFPRAMGTGDSIREAIADFEVAVEEMYEFLSNEKMLGYKRGRPAKGGVSMNVSVRPETKEYIENFRAGLEISQGEVLDYFARVHQSFVTNEAYIASVARVHISQLIESIASISADIEQLKLKGLSKAKYEGNPGESNNIAFFHSYRISA